MDNLDFVSILAGAAFTSGDVSGGHPDTWEGRVLEPTCSAAADVAYSALRSLGRVDYAVSWRQTPISWHTLDGRWVIPDTRPSGDLDSNHLSHLRERLAEVLELSLGPQVVFPVRQRSADQGAATDTGRH